MEYMWDWYIMEKSWWKVVRYSLGKQMQAKSKVPLKDKFVTTKMF